MVEIGGVDGVTAVPEKVSAILPGARLAPDRLCLQCDTLVAHKAELDNCPRPRSVRDGVPSEWSRSTGRPTHQSGRCCSRWRREGTGLRAIVSRAGFRGPGLGAPRTPTRGRQTLDRVSAQPNSVAQSPYVVGSRANRIPGSSRVIPDYPG